MSIGTDIVDLLKQRESELQRELGRIRTALKALGSSSPSPAPAAPRQARAAQKVRKKGKAGRPASRVGGKTVLERIEDVLLNAKRPLRVQELAKLVGGPYSTLSTMLRRGKDEKRLANVGFGTWTHPSLAAAGGGAAAKAPKKTKKTKKAGRKPGPKKGSALGKNKKKRGRPAKAKVAASAPPSTPAPAAA